MMDRVDSRFDDSWEREVELVAIIDDDTASREMLASGMPIHISRDATPPGHVVRIHPDGHEELIRFDRAAAARTLGDLSLPSLWIVAGPNGAGKTTLVSRRLADHLIVVNPDDIAFDLPRVDGKLDQRRAGEIAIRTAGRNRFVAHHLPTWGQDALADLLNA